MVTRSYSSFTDKFGDIASGRELIPIVATGIIGAGGGILAADLAARIVQVFFGTQNPSSVGGRLATAGAKMTVGMLLAFAGSAVDHDMIGYLWSGAGIGAVIAGGVDVWGVILDANLLGGAPRRSSRRLSSATRGSRARQARSRARRAGAAEGRARQVRAAGSASPNTQANPERTNAYGDGGSGPPTAYA